MSTVPMAQIPAQAGVTTRPSMVTAIAVMTLVSGVLNLLGGVGGLVAGVVAGVVFGFMPQMFSSYEFRDARFVGPMMLTIGIITFLILVALAIFYLVLAFLELRYGIQLLANPPKALKPARHIAVMEIVAIIGGNIIAAVIGVLALVFYADPSVQAYFAAVAPSQPARRG